MSIDRIELRNAFGQFATGVTVITTNPEGYEPLGMTVNSFSSLSLEPALLLWSIQNDSECLAAFNAADTYAVNVLADSGEELSRFYAQKGDHALREADYHLGEAGCPVLNACLTSFECAIEERVDGGDHTILIGRVLAFNAKPDLKPLVFFGGQYQSLAE